MDGARTTTCSSWATTAATPTTAACSARSRVVHHRPGLHDHLAARPDPVPLTRDAGRRMSEPARYGPGHDRTIAQGRPRRGRAAAAGRPRLAVAVARGRLQDLPAALPLPLHRPAARVPVARRHPRHARARGARVAVRPACGAAHARRGRAGCCPRRGQRVRAEAPDVDELFADDADGTDFAEWLASAAELLGNYFRLEDPSRLEPAAREQLVEVIVDGVRLRGYVDRIDVSPAGDLRVVDYKTGASPREAFEAQGAVPDEVLRAGALAHPRRRAAPAAADVPHRHRHAQLRARTPRSCRASSARSWPSGPRSSARVQTGDFRPSPGRLCDWCDHKALLPGVRRHAAAVPAERRCSPTRATTCRPPSATGLITRRGSAGEGDQRDRRLGSVVARRGSRPARRPPAARRRWRARHGVAGADHHDVADPVAGARRHRAEQPGARSPRPACSTSARSPEHRRPGRRRRRRPRPARCAGSAPAARRRPPARPSLQPRRRCRGRRGRPAAMSRPPWSAVTSSAASAGRPSTSRLSSASTSRGRGCHCGDAMPCTCAAVSSSAV